MRKDLVLHFVAGAVIALIAQASILVFFGYHSYFIPAIIAAVSGVGKEIYDLISKKGTPDLNDAIFTCLGGGLCLAIWGIVVNYIL